MTHQADLDALYEEAREALASKDSRRAGDLLKQILIYDEDFKDASRLLAQVVTLQRRRWYGDLRIWGGGASLIVLAVGVVLVLRSLLSPGSPSTPTATAAGPIPPAEEPTEDPTLSATISSPTTVPLAWKRTSVGQELARDTVTAILLAPHDSDVMYVGTENAGIYRSIDRGVSWQPAQAGLARASIRTLILDPQQPSTLYAGTHLGGVYRTDDAGMHWVSVSQGLPAPGWEISIVAIDPIVEGDLLYTASMEVHATTDGGRVWRRVKDSSTCPDLIVGLVRHPKDGSRVYATNFSEVNGRCPAGVYRSDDGGHTWMHLGLDYIWPYWNGLAIDPASDLGSGTLYTFTTSAELFVSRDDGLSWKQTATGCNMLAADPLDSTTVYCFESSDARSSMFKYSNGGEDLLGIFELPIAGDKAIKAAVVSPYAKGTIWMGAVGLWVSPDDGSSWNELRSGLPAGPISLRLDPADVSALYLEDAACQPYRSSDGGRNWRKVEEWGCGMSSSRGGEARYWTNGDQVFASVDSGRSWVGNSILETTQILTVAAHPSMPGRVFSIAHQETGTTIFASGDYGKTWHATSGSHGDARIFFGDDVGQRMYAVPEAWEILYSDDAGETWGTCASIGWYATGDTRLLVDPANLDRLLLATRGLGVMASGDGCLSWESSNTGLGSLFVNTLAIDPQNPDTVYAGTDGGAYVSFDGGRSWGPINEGLLGATVVYSIVVDPQSNVYAATPYGVFKLETR